MAIVRSLLWVRGSDPMPALLANVAIAGPRRQRLLGNLNDEWFLYTAATIDLSGTSRK